MNIAKSINNTKNNEVVIPKLMQNAIVAESDIIIQMELITPERAAELLAENKDNRPFSVNNQKTFENDMRNGTWSLTDQAITISDEDTLINGQHRLKAIIATNIPQKMFVSYRVPKGSFINYDRVKARNYSDALAIQNVKYYKIISEGINLFHARVTKKYWDMDSGSKKKEQLTNAEKDELYFNNKSIIDEAALISNQHYCKGQFSKSSIVAYIMYLIIAKKYDKDKVFSFFVQILEGHNVTLYSISTARNYLAGMATDKIYKPEQFLYVLIQAWHYYINGMKKKPTYIVVDKITKDDPFYDFL